jgi:4-hydroxy-tetrahydrodipicolinate reductase
MKIVLIGYGKMGQSIERLALKSGHEIVLKINSQNAGTIKPADLAGADVAIEFSKPETAFRNIMLCFEANLPVVCGTTGWNERLPMAENICKEKNQAFFYSTNFSIGVNLFFEVNTLLAKLMNDQRQYDEIIIHEYHHTAKLDSPSGTAIALAGQILSHVKRLKQWVNYKADENLSLNNDSQGELPIFSTREDDIPGTHIVKYFSDVDEIEIIHKALTREGFVLGAISAAEWLIGKKGVYSMKDLLK